MKEKDPIVERLTTWTMYLIFGVLAGLAVTAFLWGMIGLWRRILEG